MYGLVTTWQITIIFDYNLSFSEPTFLLCELQTYCFYIFFVILPSIFYNCYCPGLKNEHQNDQFIICQKGVFIKHTIAIFSV